MSELTKADEVDPKRLERRPPPTIVVADLLDHRDDERKGNEEGEVDPERNGSCRMLKRGSAWC